VLSPRFKRNFGRFWRRLSRSQTHEDVAREQMLAIGHKLAESIKKSQAECPHMQGSILGSEAMGNYTSIVWHGLDRGGKIFGVCTNCLREFWPSDPDYTKWRKMLCGNRMSTGGLPGLSLVTEAITPPPISELDAMSDEEIVNLFEQTRKHIKESRGSSN
jgi:hypothetical protein